LIPPISLMIYGYPSVTGSKRYPVTGEGNIASGLMTNIESASVGLKKARMK